jgi:hypothetical protein
MAGRSWRETGAALETITPICVQRDADGVDIYFLNRKNEPHFSKITSPNTVVKIFEEVRPGGATPVTVYGVRTSQVPRGGEMVPPHLDQHLLHLSRS